MPSKSVRRFYRRRFLNRPGHHAGAFVLAELTVESPTKWAKSGSLDGVITLGDCNRTVTLDFSGNGRAEWTNALHKARVLRDTLDAFVEELESAVDDARNRRLE